jgi:imidazolonepropionase-like amidohydrolase
MTTLTNARVFDGTKMLPGRRNVTLDGNKIVSVSEQPATGKSIDVGGMTVMPGMITSHYHIDFFKFTIDHNKNGIMLGTELPPGVLAAIGVRNCGVLLESGFTGYNGASCGHDLDAQLKIAIKEGIFKGPRIKACGHHLGSTASVNDNPKWWLRTEMIGTDIFVDGPDEMRKAVREDIRRGSQIIKLFASGGHGFPGHHGTSRTMSRDEIEAAVNAAHERGALVRAHVADKAMIMECLELGVDILDHADRVDEECIDIMIKQGTYWVPSQIYIQTLINMGFADDFVKEEFAHVQKTLPLAQKAGVKILSGDDYSGIFRDFVKDDPLDHQVGNYAREFPFYTAIDGLTPSDVLSWATKNPGTLLADPGTKVGVVEAGALADLIVVDGDPVADITILSKPQQHLKAVIVDGDFVIDRLPTQNARMAAE